MRGLSLLDLLVILLVLALLIYAGSHEFAHYQGRTLATAVVATPTPAAGT